MSLSVAMFVYLEALRHICLKQILSWAISKFIESKKYSMRVRWLTYYLYSISKCLGVWVISSYGQNTYDKKP